MSQQKDRQHTLTIWLFLRLVGVIYLVAFLSAAPQVTDLIGEHGLLPVDRFFALATRELGPARLLFEPSLLWFASGDLPLQGLCWLGALSALMVVTGVFSGPALFVCYLLYLSLVTVGQDFMSFQWDWLLLETGFIGLFLTSWRSLQAPVGRTTRASTLSPWLLWALRLIIFKLMFMSGMAKLTSGDANWANLTALNYHYLTQPLPTPLGWFAGHLPGWFQKLSVAAMFYIELLVPFFIFCGRRLRLAAAAQITALLVLIALTGNYTYFDILSIILCVPLLDDHVTSFLLPRWLKERALPESVEDPGKSKLLGLKFIAALLIVLTASKVTGVNVPFLTNLTAPFGISNGYGLFAVMTTVRNEIIIEGSKDGKNWLEYELPYKPGDVRRAPPIVAPLQPRLDWQLWFASLTDYREEPWFGHLMLRLLTGSRDVLHLFSKNPFDNVAPPKYVRASLYRYEFTSLDTLLKTGVWWRRSYVGPYFPAASLEGPMEVD